MLKAAGDGAHRLKKDDARDQYLGYAREILQGLADSIHDVKLQRRFLVVKPVRELGL